MAKLDLMELKRNHVGPLEDEAALPDDDDKDDKLDADAVNKDNTGTIVKGEEVGPVGEREGEEVAAPPREKNELAEAQMSEDKVVAKGELVSGLRHGPKV
jgi:hypothetical protein